VKEECIDAGAYIERNFECNAIDFGVLIKLIVKTGEYGMFLIVSNLTEEKKIPRHLQT